MKNHIMNSMGNICMISNPIEYDNVFLKSLIIQAVFIISICYKKSG